VQKKLGNEGFVKKAPEKVIEEPNFQAKNPKLFKDLIDALSVIKF